MHLHGYQKTFTGMLNSSTIFKSLNTRNFPKCTSSVEQMNKLWCIYTVHSGNENEWSTTTCSKWMNIPAITLSKRRQTPMSICCMIQFIYLEHEMSSNSESVISISGWWLLFDVGRWQVKPAWWHKRSLGVLVISCFLMWVPILTAYNPCDNSMNWTPAEEESTDAPPL